MAWDKMSVHGRGTAMVTVRSTSVAFSAYFVNNEQLISMEYVEVFEDTELRRIGFKFTNSPKGHNVLALKQDGGKKGERKNNGRIVFTDLRKSIWIKSVIKKDSQKYLILKDSEFDNNKLFYIELGYSYSNNNDFENVVIFPEIPGVYRLFNKKHELIRIGEGQNIKLRLLVHKKNDSQNNIKLFNYCEIQDKLLRKNEEKRLLEEYKIAHNKCLPQLNAITA